MKKKLLKLTAVLVTLMTVSCSSVMMNKALPNNSTEDQREELVGEWSTEDGSFQVNFDSKGVGCYAGLEWNAERGKFEIYSQKFILTQIEDDLYLSFQAEQEEEGEEPQYNLTQCLMNERDLILWKPDTDRFEELLKQKKLSGEVNKQRRSTEVVLTNSPKEIVEILKNEKGLFSYKEPFILRRLSE